VSELPGPRGRARLDAAVVIIAQFLPLTPVGDSLVLMQAPQPYAAGSSVLWRNGIELIRTDPDGYVEVAPDKILLNEPLRPGEFVQLFCKLI
jgi:hypothetical protein